MVRIINLFDEKVLGKLRIHTCYDFQATTLLDVFWLKGSCTFFPFQIGASLYKFLENIKNTLPMKPFFVVVSTYPLKN